MRVKIVNSITAVELNVSRATFVASLKARYSESEGFVGDVSSINLVFRGRPLEDLKQLKDYGIEHGAVIAHVTFADEHEGSRVDYKQVSTHLEAARSSSLGGQLDPEEFSRDANNSSWPAGWSRGKEWETMPTMMLGNTGVTQADIFEDEEASSASHVTQIENGTPKHRLLTEQATAGTSRRSPRTDDDGIRGGTPYAGHDALDAARATAAAPRTPAETTARENLIRMREAQRAKQAIIARAPEVVAPYSPEHGVPIRRPARFFRQLYVAQVGRFMFRVLHRMEGRWTGDAEVHLPGRRSVPDSRVCTVSLSFDDIAGIWNETQGLTTRDGLVSKQGMILRPVADGVCAVELVDSPHPGAYPDVRTRMAGSRKSTATDGAGHGSAGVHGARSSGRDSAPDYDMTLTEQSDHLLVLTAYSRSTGMPILVETTTLISDMARVRTVQRFADTGELQCMYLIREERVIDAVTGAVVEPPPRSRAPRQAPMAAPRSAGHARDFVETGVTGSAV